MRTIPTQYADVVTVRLVAEYTVPVESVSGPDQVAKVVAPFFDGHPVERFVVVMLNTSNRIIAISVVTEGILNSSLVHPREIFNRAILANAAGIILAHNHPSGSKEPSAEDQRITRQVVEAGKILGIPVHDHVILPAGGGYTSFAEKGLI